MNNNQAARDIILQWVRHRTFIWGGMTVNRSRCLVIDKSPELQYLLKHGIVERKRVKQSQNTYYTVLVPTDGVERATLPRCPICDLEQEWTSTPTHKMSCPARYN